VSRIEYRLPLVLVLTMLAPRVLLGQQSPEAQQHLSAAARALNSIDSKSASGDSGKALAAVRRDFQDMQRALADSNPSASGQNDWRAKYSAIERDLTGLIGSVNTPPGQPATAVLANATPLDAPTRVSLEDFRNHVELFYAAMTGTQPPNETTASQPPVQPPPTQATQPPQPTQATTPQPTQAAPPQPTPAAQPTQPTAGAQPAPAPAAQPAVDSEGAGALLDRMQTILDAALGNPPADNHTVGTSGVLPGVDSKSKAGRVSVDRAALDEVLAEVQQLRTMLRVRQ
jgi:hypothetical protein